MESKQPSPGAESSTEPTQGTGERVPDKQRDLEGLSGMVPGTRRRDNRDDQPDAYLEFNQMRPSGDERLRGAKEEAELDRVNPEEPSEDKG